MRSRLPRRGCCKSPTSWRSDKADRDGAETNPLGDLRSGTKGSHREPHRGSGQGIADLVAAIDDHRRTDSRERRLARARALILSLPQPGCGWTQPDLDGLCGISGRRPGRPVFGRRAAAVRAQVSARIDSLGGRQFNQAPCPLQQLPAQGVVIDVGDQDARTAPPIAPAPQSGDGMNHLVLPPVYVFAVNSA